MVDGSSHVLFYRAFFVCAAQKLDAVGHVRKHVHSTTGRRTLLAACCTLLLGGGCVQTIRVLLALAPFHEEYFLCPQVLVYVVCGRSSHRCFRFIQVVKKINCNTE